MIRTQVAIVGAGPAGLMLGHLLDRHGVDSVIVESRAEDYVLNRVRAGVLDQNTVDLMIRTGIGERLRREGLRHDGIWLAFGGVRRFIDFARLTGKSVTIYGQNEVLKDLFEARRRTGLAIHFEAERVSVHDCDEDVPKVRFRSHGAAHEIRCDFIAGCDGFHGICRPSIPAGIVTSRERTLPFAWLGILAEAAPSSDELVYALHERGFALFSMRSPSITRLYLQCGVDDDLAQWPNDRIWAELIARLSTDDGWRPSEGPILQKSITPMRSFVAEPMRWGNLFLAGDAAHIVPPTGAKGMNLAMADVCVLALALSRYYRSGDRSLLDSYSQTCLRRVWQTQRFSCWMTGLLHRTSGEDDFNYRTQLAELEYIAGSAAGMTSLAENYVGLPLNLSEI